MEFINNKYYLDKYIEILENCTEVVEHLLEKEAILVRGSNRSEFVDFVPVKNTDRLPRDTHLRIDQYVDSFRKEEFYDVPNRKRSVFCYLTELNNMKSHLNSIKVYGDRVYCIFPKNGSKYFQSQTTEDFVHVDISYLRTIDNLISGIFKSIYEIVKRYDKDYAKKILIADKNLNNNLSLNFIRESFDLILDLVTFFDKHNITITDVNILYPESKHVKNLNLYLLNNVEQLKRAFDNLNSELDMYFDLSVDKITEMNFEHEIVIEHKGYYIIRFGIIQEIISRVSTIYIYDIDKIIELRESI